MEVCDVSLGDSRSHEMRWGFFFFSCAMQYVNFCFCDIIVISSLVISICHIIVITRLKFYYETVRTEVIKELRVREGGKTLLPSLPL